MENLQWNWSSWNISAFFLGLGDQLFKRGWISGFAQVPTLSILFMYSLYSVAEYGFCMLVPMIEIDYSSSQCILWSWDCCLEDCRDLSLPIESFALKNCKEDSKLALHRFQLTCLHLRDEKFELTQFAVFQLVQSECYSNVGRIVQPLQALPFAPLQFPLWFSKTWFVPHCLFEITIEYFFESVNQLTKSR